MRCAVLENADSPPVMRERDSINPDFGQVRVRLKAAALNHRDVWITKGLYPGIEFPIILGSDGAGVVEAVGEGAEPWMGQEVIINPALEWGPDERAQGDDFRILGLPDDGTFAQEVIVPARQLAEKPAHLSWEQAATLPLAGLTAWRAVSSRGGLTEKETILITGIGGGVALFALQFAKALGARVAVTSSSAEKLARAVELGAAYGFNYREEKWHKSAIASLEGVDLTIDGAGGSGYEALVDLAKPGGRIVNYGATAGNPEGVPLRKVFWKQLNILGSTMGSPDDFTEMVEFVAQEKIEPVMDEVFSLEDVGQALARMDRGDQFGKIVLQIP